MEEDDINTRKLTKRQLEVLAMWYEAPSARIASSNLQISLLTFHTHLRDIRRVLQVNKTLVAYKICHSKGLI